MSKETPAGDMPGTGKLAYLGTCLRDMLVSDPRVGQQDLRLAIDEQQLLLSGSVATEGHHDAVMEVVHEAVPGIIVRDDLQVVDMGTTGWADGHMSAADLEAEGRTAARAPLDRERAPATRSQQVVLACSAGLLALIAWRSWGRGSAARKSGCAQARRG
jgi:hypothetical protein